MQQSKDPRAADPYLTWQELLDEEDAGGLPVDSTPERDAPAGGPAEQAQGDSPPALQLPADVQALMAEKERLEGELARLAGHGAPHGAPLPEEERMKRMYPVRVHTKESRIEDRRLRRHDEHQRVLKQRVLEKKLVAARDRQRQEELEAQRKRRALEAALARVRAQARAAEAAAQRRRKAIERALAGVRAEQQEAERAAEQERKEIERALVQARWESDRARALAARARERRQEVLDQEVDLSSRRRRAMESMQARQAAQRAEARAETRAETLAGALAETGQERRPSGAAMEAHAGSAKVPGDASGRAAQRKIEEQAWEQARDRQREQALARRRAERVEAESIDRRSKKSDRFEA